MSDLPRIPQGNRFSRGRVALARKGPGRAARTQPQPHRADVRLFRLHGVQRPMSGWYPAADLALSMRHVQEQIRPAEMEAMALWRTDFARRPDGVGDTAVAAV